jgi:predicted nucleotidyltransferase
MTQGSPREDSLKKAIRIIVRVAEPDRIILFGSHGRGDAGSTSDFDLLVLKRGVQKERELAQKIYLNFHDIGAPVDVIVADLDRYEQLKADPYLIYSEASNSGRLVYEKS